MAMPQVDWESIRSFVQIPLSWFKEISRRSNIFSRHPLIIIERNNPDGIALNIDLSQLPKDEVSSRTDFEPSARGITGGVVCIARQYYKVEAFSGEIADGQYRLSFTFETSGLYTAQIEAGSGFDSPTDTVSYAPLFKIQGGKIVEDYRNAIYLMVRE